MSRRPPLDPRIAELAEGLRCPRSVRSLLALHRRAGALLEESLAAREHTVAVASMLTCSCIPSLFAELPLHLWAAYVREGLVRVEDAWAALAMLHRTAFGNYLNLGPYAEPFLEPEAFPAERAEEAFETLPRLRDASPLPARAPELLALAQSAPADFASALRSAPEAQRLWLFLQASPAAEPHLERWLQEQLTTTWAPFGPELAWLPSLPVAWRARALALALERFGDEAGMLEGCGQLAPELLALLPAERRQRALQELLARLTGLPRLRPTAALLAPLVPSLGPRGRARLAVLCRRLLRSPDPWTASDLGVLLQALPVLADEQTLAPLASLTDAPLRARSLEAFAAATPPRLVNELRRLARGLPSPHSRALVELALWRRLGHRPSLAEWEELLSLALDEPPRSLPPGRERERLWNMLAQRLPPSLRPAFEAGLRGTEGRAARRALGLLEAQQRAPGPSRPRHTDDFECPAEPLRELLERARAAPMSGPERDGEAHDLLLRSAVAHAEELVGTFGSEVLEELERGASAIGLSEEGLDRLVRAADRSLLQREMARWLRLLSRDEQPDSLFLLLDAAHVEDRPRVLEAILDRDLGQFCDQAPATWRASLEDRLSSRPLEASAAQLSQLFTYHSEGPGRSTAVLAERVVRQLGGPRREELCLALLRHGAQRPLHEALRLVTSERLPAWLGLSARELEQALEPLFALGEAT